jgi:hypothetical protein
MVYEGTGLQWKIEKFSIEGNWGNAALRDQAADDIAPNTTRSSPALSLSPSPQSALES